MRRMNMRKKRGLALLLVVCMAGAAIPAYGMEQAQPATECRLAETEGAEAEAGQFVAEVGVPAAETPFKPFTKEELMGTKLTDVEAAFGRFDYHGD